MKILTCFLAATLISHAAPEAIFDGKSLAGWKTAGADVWTAAEAKDKGPIGLQVHPGVAMKIDFRAIAVASE